MAASYYANHVLDALQITNPDDLRRLELIAWERKAIVTSAPLGGAEARLAAQGGKAIITISSAIANARRRRFSIAHELGHWEMHRSQLAALGVIICKDSDIENEVLRKGQGAAQREWEANEFAAALLLPDRFFIPLCLDKDPSLELIVELADAFEVSRTATALRYVGCSAEPCAVILSEDGYIKWHRGSRTFDQLGLFIDWGSELSSGTFADRFFQGRSLPQVRKPVRISAWFAPGTYRSDARIQEQSFAIPSRNAVLSLLWVDEDLEEADDEG